MKKCPYCSEEIQEEAIKCKHCGEWLEKKEEQALNNGISDGKNSTQLGFSHRQNIVYAPPLEKPNIKTERLYEAYLGERNSVYYLAKFNEFDGQSPGLKASWNWAALLPIWPLYRKMYGLFFAVSVISCSLYISIKESGSLLVALILIAPLFAYFTYANSLYHNNIKKKIAAAQLTIKDETRLLEYLCQKGGVNTWVIYVSTAPIIFGIVFAIVFPFFKVPESKSFALLITGVISGLIIWILYDILNREKKDNSGGNCTDGKKPDESQDVYIERIVREAEEQAAKEARSGISKWVIPMLAIGIVLATVASYFYYKGKTVLNAAAMTKSSYPLIKTLEAAEQGNAWAQNKLGSMYHTGKRLPLNYNEALKWYTKAAEQGYAWAQYNIGVMYDNGQGVTQDHAEAIKWYRKAAGQGDATMLGVMYHNGQGVTQDYAEAIKWYRKAAEQGNADAQFNLGRMYAEGKGITQNYNEAIKWYTKAAEQGNADAQNNLGVMYQNGQGITKDNTKAMKWYRKAAEQGNKDAQNNLDLVNEQEAYKRLIKTTQ